MVKTKHPSPGRFFEEEERLGFQIDRQRKELWAVELDMLFELDRVCRKLKIRYFLDGGTLLGAARDGHIIPWDDDIDVAMLRKDYDRFLRKAPREFEEPFFLQTGYTEPDYFRGHCQLRRSDTCAILPQELGKVSFNQGIFLDIFVLDELFPEKAEDQYRRREELWLQRCRCNDRSYRGHPLRWVAKQGRYWLYHHRYPRSADFYARLERVFRSRKKSEYVDYLMLNGGPEQLHFLKRSWYEKTAELSFEGKAFPAPQGYRDYLACYYGEDWETPKNRASMHNADGQVIFDVSRSYRDVLNERLSLCTKAE